MLFWVHGQLGVPKLNAVLCFLETIIKQFVSAYETHCFDC